MRTIKYYLQPNPITPDPNDQSARVSPNSVLTLEEVLELMLLRGTSFTKPDIMGILSLFFDVTTNEVASGNHINTPLVNLKPGISGIFTSAADGYDNTRHTIKASISAGTLLNRKLSDAQAEKIRQPMRAPYLLEYTDATAQIINSIITPGGIGTIVGEELKFEPANLSEGVFLIHESKTETRALVYATRTEGRIIFNIPLGLVAGSYKLEVRRAYGINNEIRVGELNDTLTVIS